MDMAGLRRCSSCVLPETIPNIRFDGEGKCNQCQNAQQVHYLGEEHLLRLFAQKQPGQNYDCILGVSGGRDSSYALWLLSKQYKLNVLAIHYHSPFAHPIAYENVNRMVDILNIPLIVIEDEQKLHDKTFRNNLIAFFKEPNPAMLSMMCVACKLKWVNMYRIAKKEKISVIMAASNPYENTSFKKEFHSIGYNENSPYKKYFKRFLTGMKAVAKNPSYINSETLKTTVLAFAYLDSSSPMLKLLYPNIIKTDLFYFLPWDEKTVLSTITTELGWKKPEDEASSWRFDCKIGLIKDFLYMTMFGFTEKDDLYSKMIRDGLMTREIALQRLREENVVSAVKVNECLEPYGLSLAKLFSLNKAYWSQYAVYREALGGELQRKAEAQ